MMKFDYPKAKREEQVSDDYHGKIIKDPYRWLEDLNSNESKVFINAQNSLAIPFLEKCSFRINIKDRITKMYDYPKIGCPFKEGDKWYYFYNTGLQNHSILYAKSNLDDESEEGQLVLDPNSFSEDGSASLNSYSFSEDGHYLAYAISYLGSDWTIIKIRNVITKLDYDEVLNDVKFSPIAWTHDNLGFFYLVMPRINTSLDKGTLDLNHEVNNAEVKQEMNSEKNINQTMYYHRLDTNQSQDIMCAKWPENPNWMMNVTVSDDGKYLICEIFKDCEPVNRLYICDLNFLSNTQMTGPLSFIKIVDNFVANYSYLTNEEEIFTFKTDLNAPRCKIININLNDYAKDKWVELVKESDKNVLEWACCVSQDKLVLCYLSHVKNLLHVHSLKSGERIAVLNIPVGSIGGLYGKKIYNEIFYKFISFLTPSIIYRCRMDLGTFEPKIYKETIIDGLDASLFETNQVFYPATNDSQVKIPMFIIHKKGIKLDGSHPLLLYGYGGFHISILPSFSVSRLIFIQNMGGILAIANIRGGSEYGNMWYREGILSKKQNSYDDFQEASKYLISNGYTNPERLAINGASNGGLLVSVCSNQRPELYKAVVAVVGVMDILRFHKFTCGQNYVSDYGCSDNAQEFESIMKYSPLHNVAPKGSYQHPATLFLTAEHDDRVPPFHSLKLMAELQHVFGKLHYQVNPLLLKVETKSGHGAGKSTQKMIEENTDIYCFLAETLKLSWSD